jgi:hypothetical protein
MAFCVTLAKATELREVRLPGRTGAPAARRLFAPRTTVYSSRLSLLVLARDACRNYE